MSDKEAIVHEYDHTVTDARHISTPWAFNPSPLYLIIQACHFPAPADILGLQKKTDR